jgi:hypothetical protein
MTLFYLCSRLTHRRTHRKRTICLLCCRQQLLCSLAASGLRGSVVAHVNKAIATISETSSAMLMELFEPLALSQTTLRVVVAEQRGYDDP